jgi:hypothetical protein
VSRVILPCQLRDERATYFALLLGHRKLRETHQSHSQEAVPTGCPP